MPAKKKTDPEVEEMFDEKVEEKNEKRADDVLRAEDILTVEARDVVETDEDRENSIWFELRNAHRARRILTGRMDAMERTPNGDHLVVVYYKDFRVVIPYEEMNINLIDDPDLGDINVRRDKIVGTMLGAEIDFIIKGIDPEERTIVASRKEAMMRKRSMFYEHQKSDGSYHIYEGRVVQARVIAVAEKVIRVEVFGVECPIIARDISWDWMGDCHDYYHIGDRILVRVTDIQNRDDIENLRIRADIRSITDAEMVEKLNKC
ncbi:MAG: S1 RNA-binding domain-containing protein, partial [Lachnospiraceae bacterium]|nr:S1 RNA-binding domain-containing protein [Lachnospiraceae bacterium]